MTGNHPRNPSHRMGRPRRSRMKTHDQVLTSRGTGTGTEKSEMEAVTVLGGGGGQGDTRTEQMCLNAGAGLETGCAGARSAGELSFHFSVLFDFLKRVCVFLLRCRRKSEKQANQNHSCSCSSWPHFPSCLLFPPDVRPSGGREELRALRSVSPESGFRGAFCLCCVPSC